MHDSLTKHAAQLARLAMMIRIGLENAESAIPGINDQLAELATMGVTDFQVEGPAIYCRPAGPSSAYDDSFVVYQQEPVQLAFVAEHVSRTSSGHLGRLFRQKYGMSFTEYVRELRMHKAVGMLTTTSQPIGRIAKIVGYADASRFGVHFRRRYGLTPRAYRQRFGGGRRPEAEG